MTRPLIYFAILTTFCWTTLISLTFLIPPISSDNQPNFTIIGIMLGIAFLAISLLAGLVVSFIKIFLPDRKLPHLLIRDSLIVGGFIGAGASGLIMLQLLRVATPINLGLWLAIVGTTFWIVHTIRHPKSEQSQQTSSPISKRRTVLRKALNKR